MRKYHNYYLQMLKMSKLINIYKLINILNVCVCSLFVKTSTLINI